ncbi:MAG TPA: hypothetical protein VGD27_00315 [Longimicrobiales bacterium]
MRFRSLLLATAAMLVFAPVASAQAITDEVLTAFIRGRQAEQPELEKVGAEIAALDEKIKEFRACAEVINETMSGLKAKVALKAKCGATSVDGMLKDRAKLLAAPEKAGAAAAGMDVRQYAKIKDGVILYLGGDRNFAEGELAALGKHATTLSNVMGMALAKASESGGGGAAGRRVGNAVGGQMRMFTPDMTWAYVGYLWGLMYMSGATMFETAYQPGQWTRWEITDASQPDQKMVLERALLSREADKSEWWRIKTIQTTPEATDTIILETQMKALDAEGLSMQVVRMRGKMPGDTEGKELMVPQHLSMLSMGAFPMKPTKESVAGATVGTENIRVGANSFAAQHVKFGAGTGNMEWWLADKAPGTVVKVQFSGQDADEKWLMQMVESGSGAKSELGVK